MFPLSGVRKIIICRLFLKRKLSNLQWMAIGLLAVGTTTSQVLLHTHYASQHIAHLSCFSSEWFQLFSLSLLFQVKGCGEASCDSLFTAPIQGYLLGILSAALSALAGIYTEFLMKRNNDSLYWQNLQLYT